MKKILMILVLIGLGSLLFIPTNVLTIKVDGKINQLHFYEDGELFSLRWVHSVEKEEWEEFFYVQDDKIFIQSTRFKTFGAGVPSHAGKQSFIKNGWVYMTDIHREIGDVLAVRTGKETHHRFIYDGKTVEWEHPEKSYQIQSEKSPLIKAIYYYLK